MVWESGVMRVKQQANHQLMPVAGVLSRGWDCPHQVLLGRSRSQRWSQQTWQQPQQQDGSGLTSGSLSSSKRYRLAGRSQQQRAAALPSSDQQQPPSWQTIRLPLQQLLPLSQRFQQGGKAPGQEVCHPLHAVSYRDVIPPGSSIASDVQGKEHLNWIVSCVGQTGFILNQDPERRIGIAWPSPRCPFLPSTIITQITRPLASFGHQLLISFFKNFYLSACRFPVVLCFCEEV